MHEWMHMLQMFELCFENHEGLYVIFSGIAQCSCALTDAVVISGPCCKYPLGRLVLK